MPGRPDPILLSPQSPGLQLLQRIRDEAHRFAITFHRQRRDAASRESMFDQLEGVGPARRRALLQHFGSAERVLEASEEELEGVPGVPAKTARHDLRPAPPNRRGIRLLTTLPAVRLALPLLALSLILAGCGASTPRDDDHGDPHGPRGPVPARRRSIARPTAGRSYARARRRSRSISSTASGASIGRTRSSSTSSARCVRRRGSLRSRRSSRRSAPSSRRAVGRRHGAAREGRRHGQARDDLRRDVEAAAPGRHVAVAYGRTATTATAVAWTFRVV